MGAALPCTSAPSIGTGAVVQLREACTVAPSALMLLRCIGAVLVIAALIAEECLACFFEALSRYASCLTARSQLLPALADSNGLPVIDVVKE